MTARRKNMQLRLELGCFEEHFEGVVLSFRLNHQTIYGVLNGSINDWIFHSSSPAFLRIVPSGRLSKYALWFDAVPAQISALYNGILEAAWKAGYPMQEKDEA